MSLEVISMRLNISKSKNTTIYYVADSHRDGKKVVTNIIEKIGSHSELLAKGIDDPLKYAKDYVAKCNMNFKEDIFNYSEKIDLKEELESSSLISQSTLKNIGWLFLLKIYNQLGIKDFVKSIDTKSKYDINSIIMFLSIARILNPCSKKATFESLNHYLCAPNYQLIDSYRVLELLSKNNDLLQKILFKNTSNLNVLETDILYYDCTNYYFETETEDEDLYGEDGDIIQWGLRKYGYSKEHRPNPIIQMGLFIDKNGIPISYSLHPGQTGEITTVIPLEKLMIKNYQHSNFIYCSDSALGSYDVRFFNSLNGRHYLVTQSLKKIDEENTDAIFKDINWRFVDDDQPVSLFAFKSAIDKFINGESLSDYETELLKKDMIYKMYPISREVPAEFIKNMGIKLSGKLTMDEVIYITFSKKYYIFEKKVFNRQLASAKVMVDRKKDTARKGKSDPARLVDTISSTSSGEIAKHKSYSLDEKAIIYEEKYHGFYALATNLDKNIKDLLAINANRWKIEQSFRILKTDFDARPAFVWTQDHIRGHFAICYIALLIYRLLERKLILTDSNYSFSTRAIINTLNNLNVDEKSNSLFKSTYTGSIVLNALNKSFNLNLNKKHFRKSNLLDLFSY